ncbi:MAG: endolytic transglycosylase MltG [Candidatus Eremiobacteraeota bacterium]|nr:endolytic transglycosylase MltG [Candidatus Eremiobacteraeota bacterium]
MIKLLKFIFFLFLIAVLLVVAFGAGASYSAYYILTPMGGKGPVRVDVPKGASGGLVANNLENAGLIRNGILFRIVLRTTNSEKKIKPGNYLVDPNKNMMEILHQLTKGHGKLRLVTIPEGLTINQIADLLDKKGILNRKDFVSATKSKEYQVNGKDANNLEGYLLPETYDIPKRFNADDVVERMIGEFNGLVVPEYKKRKGSLPVKLSLSKVVILASLVEREAQVPSERPVIASVYYNRLNKGMLLQCDATVQYALGKTKPVLKYSDLEIDSPYNTYKYRGLPPGPIANPGFDSIKAVLNSQKTDYLYYVRNDKKNDGSHIFTKSLAEHNRAIKKYQK